MKESTIPTIIKDVKTIASEAQESRELYNSRFDKLDLFMDKLMSLPVLSSASSSVIHQGITTNHMMVSVNQLDVPLQHMTMMNPHLLPMQSPKPPLQSPVNDRLWGEENMNYDDN